MSKDIRFLHYRSMYQDNVSATNPLGVSSRGGVTVAYTFGEDGKISYAMAFCHERDNYNKAVGRIKAANRLKSADYRTDTEMKDNREFLDAMDAEMLEHTPSLVDKVIVPMYRKYRSHTNKAEENVANAA